MGLGALVLCACGYAEIVVEEHNGYTRGHDYDVRFPPPEGLPVVTILGASPPGLPYDFDSYYEGTSDPAPIGSLTATAGIGAVDVMVRPHEGRPYGASDVWLLQLNQTGVTGTIVELNIAGDLGALAAPTSQEV